MDYILIQEIFYISFWVIVGLMFGLPLGWYIGHYYTKKDYIQEIGDNRG